jgi:hypothetical protein
MAEIKNSFLRSKMNKDLDDRLIPNGEYRDAQNISVGKSEADDIGALETVLGNTEKTFTITPALPNDIQTIGYLTDEYTQTIFIFATNYTDSNPEVTPTYAPAGKRCIIYSWSPKNPATAQVIADGIFLNFSTTNPVQASLIEDLLFFTDNRNQPRKVNINEPNGYYTEEVQLSVAKYNPYTAISLIKTATATVEASPAPTTTTFVVDENTGILVGMSVTSMSTAGVAKIVPVDFITVISAVTAAGKTTVTLSKIVTTPTAGDIFTFLISTMTNKSSDPNWPGDPDYLEGRYVRFSYRYRFNDGEYSIFAPFTQIAYIPKQKGYFKNEDEDNAFRSTIVAWMENSVNNIELLVTLPAKGNELSNSFKIKSLDILYKESDQTTVKVLETIPVGDLSNDSINNIYTYEYQSRKPYKTLPSDQTIRVYDKIPVRALAQETAGNRIMYANFRNAYSAPDVINYDVKVIDKSSVAGGTSWIEYPNHSLKQNRNYQVGFILADKYGRQSPVILSPVSASAANNFLGSTIFHSYNTSLSNMKAWFGDTLQLSVTQGISSGTNSLPNFSTGEPGLYAIATSDNGFAINQTPVATITSAQYVFTLDSVAYTQNTVVPVEGDYLRGEYIDYVKVNGPVTNDGGTPARYTVPTDGEVNSSYLNNTTLSGVSADLNFAYTLNPIGWYSYKIVVKQTEQDYYNAYLPGIVNGYFGHTEYFGDEINQTAFSTLFGDNINKIPRDLSEVGPNQKQYRSSVLLSGRVTNVNFATTPFNAQYFPGTSNPYHSVDAVGEESILAGGGTLSQHPSIYQNETDPSLMRISTDRQAIGQQDTQAGNADFPVLAIYETDPQESLLDIFWETGTVGLVSDLNADILTGYDGPSAFTAINYSQPESKASGDPITDWFFPISNEGTQFDAAYPTTATMTYTSPRTGDDNKFVLEQDTNAASPTYKAYRIKTVGNFVYIDDSITQDVYQFAITVTVDSGSSLAPGEINTINVNGALSNTVPSFVNSPLPSIIATVDQVVLPTQDTSAVNGSSYTGTEKIQQLKWSIQSGNPTGLNGQPSFVINATTGQLTQTANNTPNGQHTVVLKIEDANGDTADGSLFATASQSIFIGPEPANNQVKSTCITGPTTNSPGIPPNGTLVTDYNGGTITGVWYLAATSLAAVDLPITPSATTSNTNTLFRLGSGALTQGQIVFSLNSGLRWANTPPPSGLQGGVSWKIWHRSNSSSAWAHITDLNNQNINTSIPVVINTANSGTFDDFYNQIILGFGQAGEYCVAAIDAESLTAGQQSQALTCWVNSNDLNYSTCVIEDGTNITGGTARASYEYGMSTNPGAGYNCSYGTTPAWSNVPYGQYVPQFFSSSTLSTPYTFPDAGGGISGYLAFKTQGSSPFDDPSSYRYSFSTRFSTADGKVYIPSPWSQCYIENCGNTAAATPTCTVLQMEFPY